MKIIDITTELDDTNMKSFKFANSLYLLPALPVEIEGHIALNNLSETVHKRKKENWINILSIFIEWVVVSSIFFLFILNIDINIHCVLE